MNFTKLNQYVDSLAEKFGGVGNEVVVYKNHELVHRYRAGYSDVQNKKTLCGNELMFLYSCSKPITCAAGLQLVERGKIRLSDNLSDYFPEFSQKKVKNADGTLIEAQNPIKIRNLFTMTTGYSYDLSAFHKMVDEDGVDKANMSTFDAIKYFAKMPLDFEPGSHFQYGISHDILAGVIEKVSGVKFGQYLRENIFDVLGMNNTYTRPDEKIISGMSQKYMAKPDGSVVLDELKNTFYFGTSMESGGAGTISCATDYIKFADAMACGGVGANGNRILAPETVELMKTRALDDACHADFTKKVSMPGHSYGLGVRTLVDKTVDGDLAPLGSFGWDGAAGCYTLFDTQNKISIFYARHLLGANLNSVIQPRLKNLVYYGFSAQ